MKKVRVSILIAIAIVIATSISAFACSYYAEASRSNTATTYYWRTGGTTTYFSWDNSNYHPSIEHSEYYLGYLHSGILTSKATGTGQLYTYDSTDSSTAYTKFTQQTYTTLYGGNISNDYCSKAR